MIDMIDRPVTRLFTWDEGRWGMVFGEPDHMWMGRPMRLIGRPDDWDTLTSGVPPEKGEDDAIFAKVKEGRKR